MTDQITERGIVLSASLLGEFDKRLVILTGHLGKITVFANGARRQNSRLSAVSQSFTMATFNLRQGRNSYTLLSAEIEKSFMDLAMDPLAYAAAAYISELTECYTQENLPAKDELNLLYMAFTKLLSGEVNQEALRAAFIFKLLHMEGEAPMAEEDIRKLLPQKNPSDTAVYAIRYIYSREISSTFSFQVSDAVAEELSKMSEYLLHESLGHTLRSEETLKEILKGMSSFRLPEKNENRKNS